MAVGSPASRTPFAFRSTYTTHPASPGSSTCRAPSAFRSSYTAPDTDAGVSAARATVNVCVSDPPRPSSTRTATGNKPVVPVGCGRSLRATRIRKAADGSSRVPSFRFPDRSSRTTPWVSLKSQDPATGGRPAVRSLRYSFRTWAGASVSSNAVASSSQPANGFSRPASAALPNSRDPGPTEELIGPCPVTAWPLTYSVADPSAA